MRIVIPSLSFSSIFEPIEPKKVCCEGAGPECDEEDLNWAVSQTEQQLEDCILEDCIDCKYT